MTIFGDKKNTILPVNLDVIVQGRSIVLRPLTDNEVNEQYLLWLNEPAINQYLDVGRNKQTMADIYNYIRALRSKKNCEIFGIFLQKGNTHVGNISITQYNPYNNGAAYFGILIGDQRAIAMGIGAQAEAMFIEFLFRQFTIRKVAADVPEVNHKSWKLLEQLGMKREGILRKEVTLASGEYCDTYLYGILKEEWMDQRKKFLPLLSNFNYY